MLHGNEAIPVEILLIEQSLSDAGRIINVLQDDKVPHRLTLFRDGAEALQFVRKEGCFARAPQPDLVLLSARPAKRTAFELIREFRTDPRLSDVAIVLVTSSPHEVFFAPRHELQSYLAKPIDPVALLAVVRQCQTYGAYEADEVDDALKAPAGIG